MKQKQAVGLHAPSGKDVAPFSSKTLAAVRKVNAKRSASFAQEEDLDEPTTSSLLPSQGEDASAMSRSGVPRLMTDENSAPVSKFHTYVAVTFLPFPNHVAL